MKDGTLADACAGGGPDIPDEGKMDLTPRLKANLEWLASNWKTKKLFEMSAYHKDFYSALQNIMDGCESMRDIELVIEGTQGRVADGYTHMLYVAPGELASNPWAAARRVGEIAEELKKRTKGGIGA